MRKILIATVPHSGTISLIAHLGLDPARRGADWFQQHCCPGTLAVARSGKRAIYTVNRSPVRVAASFGNRQRISPYWETGLNIEAWAAWWRNWWAMLPFCERIFYPEELEFHLNNTKPLDRHGLHRAIDECDWEKYYSIVPREWIHVAGVPGV